MQAEREREHLAAQNAADTGQLREMLAAREEEMVRSATEARYGTCAREKILSPLSDQVAFLLALRS